MTDFITFDQNSQERLLEVFPDLLKVTSGVEGHGYKMLSISVFDHWLTPEEAACLLQGVSTDIDSQRKSSHYCLSKKITTTLDAVTFKIENSGTKPYPVFVGFKSPAAAYKYVKPGDYNISDRFYFKLAIPNLRCIYFEGSDYTNHLYYQQESEISAILEFAEQCGLFVLR